MAEYKYNKFCLRFTQLSLGKAFKSCSMKRTQEGKEKERSAGIHISFTLFIFHSYCHTEKFIAV